MSTHSFGRGFAKSMPTTSQCGNCLAIAMALCDSRPSARGRGVTAHAPGSSAGANVDDGGRIAGARREDFVHGLGVLVERVDGEGERVVLKAQTTALRLVLHVD